MAITGNGNASKEQVAKMLQNLFNIKELPKNLDSTDGLGLPPYATYNNESISIDKKYSGWSSYIKNNPKKIN